MLQTIITAQMTSIGGRGATGVHKLVKKKAKSKSPEEPNTGHDNLTNF